ncbi:MAG: hypothetical protein IE909_11325 [Campylobacterales bacterium]|nr:hypothetical protein [Campylobacterales bacterium]
MSFSIHTPKLNRDLLRDFSKKNFKISNTALNLIFQLTPFVDRDGRVHLNKESVRRNMFCDRRSFNAALNELRETTYKGKNLLTYENGYYISSFHLSSKGDDSYLKHLPTFNSPGFQNLSKNQTRLFLYIATLNIKNQYTKVAVENLYKNSLHDHQYGMDVYDSYQDMVEDLFFLIDNGYIFVRLPKSEFHLDKNDPNYKISFNNMCGLTDKRKLRTSKYHKQKHIIGLKINPSLFEAKAISNQASEMEIRILADRYHMFHEDMKEDTFNFIIGKKNSMMEQFGMAGLSIYRTSIEKYFREKNENIVYYDLLGKAANHFTDFYLLEEIKKVILTAIKFELGDRGAFTTSVYPFAETHIPLLVNYFVANSSDEHKVLIDQDIHKIEEAHELMSGIAAGEPWTDLESSIKAVYTKHEYRVKEFFREECNKNGIYNSDILFEKINSRELVVSLASKSLLSQQKQLEQEAKKLKQIVRFFRKKKVPLEAHFEPESSEQPEESFPRTGFSWLTKE